MRKFDKTETLVTIGDMTYVREVTKLTSIVVCIIFPVREVTKLTSIVVCIIFPV